MRARLPHRAGRRTALLLLLLVPLLAACGRVGTEAARAPAATPEPATRADATPATEEDSSVSLEPAMSPGSVGMQAASEAPPRAISLSAEGVVEATPDVAYANLGFVAEGRALAPAQAEVARQSAAVTRRLQELGVRPRDMRTISYTVGRDTKRGVFVVRSGLRIVIRKIADAGKLLDAAVAAGAKRVGSLTFGIEDPAAAEREARAEAMRAAKAKANQLARLGGVQLGAPLSITEGYGGYDYGYAETAYRYPAAQAASGAPTTSIQPGQLRVAISVQVTYSIK